ncbi:2-dehydropantoate 2-reductase [Luteimonas marina]|uniref:2-dehydropantoate 2-reductase n=1 Tax=Luteimonas marina TaxID=488485 RepID=A0A5C5U9W2_9GAMM|nr:2-dehydropantoate 2-reductase [Luteimonas marina]TWT22696.1 2-dehydropantoate 2-reductase [Luteimonas marina]
MRVLVLGAGGTGGYFGGRLAQSGADVTFLVRPARAQALARDGLRIRSPLGDADIAVRTVTADTLADAVARAPYDLVVLSCKAYDLDAAIDAVAPAMGAGITLMPILNGLLHYAALDARFGRGNVLGGLCFISATLADDGAIEHLGRPASMTFGERDGGTSARVEAFAALCARAGIDHVASDDIAQEQWNKFSFLATLAAGTCLMRASVGAIVAAEGGVDFMAALHDECLAVAAAEGRPIPAGARDIARAGLTRAGSDVKASMLRDLESGGRVEAAHIVGDMWHRARAAGIDAPRLQAAWVHLQCYETVMG